MSDGLHARCSAGFVLIPLQFAGDSSGTVADDLGTAELAEDERMPNNYDSNYDRTNEVGGPKLH